MITLLILVYWHLISKESSNPASAADKVEGERDSTGRMMQPPPPFPPLSKQEESATGYTGGGAGGRLQDDVSPQQQQRLSPGSARLDEYDSQYDEEGRVQIARASRVEARAGGSEAGSGSGAYPRDDAKGKEELLLFALIQDRFDALCLPYKDQNNLVSWPVVGV